MERAPSPAALGFDVGFALGLAVVFAVVLRLVLPLLFSRTEPPLSEVEENVRATPSKIKRASGFLRTQDARAALPQNCSLGNVSPSGESENGTRVPNLFHQSASR